MAIIRAGLAGVGTLALATVMFGAPIAAQVPGGATQGPGGGIQAPGAVQAPSGATQTPGGATQTPGGAAQAPSEPGGSHGSPGSTTESGRGMGSGMMQHGMGRDTGPGTTSPGLMDPRRSQNVDPEITGPNRDDGACADRIARAAELRLDRVQRLVRPTDEQRAAFDELRAASLKAMQTLRAACSGERPLTPPARMAAAEKWLDARLQAMRILRPALDSFYKALSDEQKMRWITGGRDDRFGSRDDRFGDRDDWRFGGRDDWRFGGRQFRREWREPDWRGGDDGWAEGPGRRWRERDTDERWGGDFRRPRWRERPDDWRERWHDWHDRFGLNRDREGYRERWRNRWDDDRGWNESPRRWRDEDRGSRSDERGRDEPSQPTAPNEERL